jgi:hypothetical protein
VALIKLLPPGLHTVLGDSAGGMFTRVFYARDRLLIDQDVLSCGPTPFTANLDAWSSLRADYWNGLVAAHAAEHTPSRFNLVQNAQRLADAERVHIWAATGVSEQLFIAFMVHLVKQVGGDPALISLVQFEAAGNRRITGVGELDEQQMREHPEPAPLSVDDAQNYLNAWAALTAPEPTLLAGFAREHPDASRWLKAHAAQRCRACRCNRCKAAQERHGLRLRGARGRLGLRRFRIAPPRASAACA